MRIAIENIFAKFVVASRESSFVHYIIFSMHVVNYISKLYKVAFNIIVQNTLENEACEGLSQVCFALRDETDHFLLDCGVQVCVARYHRRLQLLLRAVFAVSGQAVQTRVLAQQAMLRTLHQAAREVQTAKTEARQLVLARWMEQLHHHLTANPTLVPLSASKVIHTVICFYRPGQPACERHFNSTCARLRPGWR